MKKIYLILGALLTIWFSAYSQVKTTTSENVFVITFDGLRWQELFGGADEVLIADSQYVDDPEGLKRDFWNEDQQVRREMLFPFVWSELEEKGQLYGNRNYGNRVDCTNKMLFSYPGYNEILTGFSDDQRINSNDKINNPNTTVLEFINGIPKFSGKVAAFGSWDVFPFIINSERSGIPVNAGYMAAIGDDLSENEKMLNQLQVEIPGQWSSVRFDAFTHHYALEYLKKERPRLVYISYGETDDWAHDGDYEEYLYSARRTDQFIRELWDFAQSQSQYKDKTTFLITTDHGRGTVPVHTWRSHGKEIAGAEEIWLMAIGPDTPATGEVKMPGQLYQNQVAATVATLLGVKYVNKPEPGSAVKAVFNEE